MTIEIELKYLVIPPVSDNGEDECVVIDKITHHLTRKQIKFSQSQKKLSNHYFDTPELDFRRYDMGLRVRENSGDFEQTIKTSGQVIAGLHQRPEFNVDIEGNFPTLSLFPDEIWQDNQSIASLQTKLLSIFSTNFSRTTWLIQTENDDEIELVFDQGTISVDGRSENICEIEIELIKGKTDDLFHLAKQLFFILQLRPGIKSKAERGYALWKNQITQAEVYQVELIPLNNTSSITNVFSAGLSFCLNEMQRMIDGYIAEPSLTLLSKIVQILAVIRHGFWLFEKYLPVESTKLRNELSYFVQLFSWVDSGVYLQELTNKTGNYRTKLNLSSALIIQIKMEKRQLPNAEQVTTLMHSRRFNQLQLSLLKLLLDLQAIEKQEEYNDYNLMEFAQQSLTGELAALVKVIDTEDSLTSEQCFLARRELHRSLLTGNWVGSLFEEEKRVEYRAPWLDLQQGISELQALWMIQKQLKKLDEQPDKLCKWQDSKVENLLLALGHSRDNALSMSPYWLNS